LIWNNLSTIDSFGRINLLQACGGDQLEIFNYSLRELAQQLTAVRKSLDLATSALACERIAPLYESIVHQDLCVEQAGIVTAAFLLFLALGISTLAMISLRAAWGQKIVEAKIYKESEVDENMIVDEHEEYLAYISRYKHEWQEYGGLGSALRRTLSNNLSNQTPINAARSTPAKPGELHEAFDPYDNHDGNSLSTGVGDISFQSLRDPNGVSRPRPVPRYVKHGKIDWWL
jgi:hypothetical protein